MTCSAATSCASEIRTLEANEGMKVASVEQLEMCHNGFANKNICDEMKDTCSGLVATRCNDSSNQYHHGTQKISITPNSGGSFEHDNPLTSTDSSLSPLHGSTVDRDDQISYNNNRLPLTPQRSALRQGQVMEDHYVKAKGPWKCLPKPDVKYAKTAASPCHKLGDGSHQKPRRRRVGFESVEIRSFKQTLGDNPSVSYGPPIQLDWDFEDNEPMRLDSYEASKTIVRKHPREFGLNSFQRANLLLYYCGVSKEDIDRVQKEMDKIKFQRRITSTFLITSPIQDFVESAGRKTKRFLKIAK